MTEADDLTDADLCRLAAERLARDDPGTLYGVTHPDGDAEAAAHVAPDGPAVAVADDGDGASYTVYGESPVAGLDGVPEEVVSEPFRGGVRRSGGEASISDAVWVLAKDTLPGNDVDLTGVDIEFAVLDDALAADARDYRSSVVSRPEPPLTVAAVRMETPAAPAQWYGVSAGGVPVYVRYRGGRFQFRAGGRRGVDGETLHDEQLGDSLDGALTIEEAIEAVPDDIATFDFDPGSIEDIADAEFDPERINELFAAAQEDGYDRDAEFADLCRRQKTRAWYFANLAAGALAADAYLRAHPDRDPLEIDRDRMAGRRHVLEELHKAYADAADAVEEDGDYASAAASLREVSSVAESAATRIRHAHDIPVDQTPSARRLLPAIDREYRAVFVRVDDLLDRAEHEAATD